MDLLLGYLAGLLTLINPRVLPILPIVLVTSLQAGRSSPLVLAVRMSLSFVTLGLFVAVLGRTFCITEEAVSNVAAILMIGFGLALLVRQLSARFATATAGISTQADSGMDHIDRDGLRVNSPPASFLVRYGAPASVPHLAEQSHLPARAKAFCGQGRSWSLFRLAYRRSSLLWATAHNL